MMKKLVIFISLSISFLLGQNYLWPTNSSKKLSATFGEYRSGHFHAGIDIKTNNKNGYPCYAIESGYVSRIVVKPYGYGKAVYLKLHDGNVVVYAHLDGFSDEIEALVRKEQQHRGQYSITKYLKKGQLPVKKGDIVAYTGVTGTRHPHLHFEIRDPNHHPINPLQFETLNMQDITPPKINKIAVIPVSGKTLVNQSPESLILKPRRIAPGTYRIPDPVYTTDAVAVEISTYDIVRGLWNKYGPAKLKLFLNDSLYFFQQVDKFSYNNTHLITIDRNYQLMAEGEGRFIRMWQYDETADHPFHKSKGDGIIVPTETPIQLRLEIYDFNDNKSEVTLTLLPEIMQPPKILSVTEDSTAYHFTVKRDTATHLYRSFDLTWISDEIMDNTALIKFRKTDSTYYFATAKKRKSVLKLTGISNKTGQSLDTYYIPGGSDNSVSVDFDHNARTFFATLNFQKPPKYNPELYLQTDQNFSSIPLVATSQTVYKTAINNFLPWIKAHTLEVRAGGDIVLRKQLTGQAITPKTAGELQISGAKLTYPPEVVYDTLLVQAAMESDFTNGHFELLSAIYQFSPANQQMKNSATLTLDYKDGIDNIDQVGIYSIFPTRAYFVGGKVDTVSKTVTTKISSFGKYALVRDAKPPRITKIYPANGKYYKRSSVPEIKAEIDDELSKIDGEQGIVMKLNGKMVIAEWHPIHHTLTYEPEERLTKGKHHLYISVRDRAGNITEKESRFVIVD